MAKAKAPRWLTTAFAEGVLELAPPRPAPAYPGALGRCWLAQHDERRRPCSGPFERFHFIGRQRVENALGAILHGAMSCPECWGMGEVPGDFASYESGGVMLCPVCGGGRREPLLSARDRQRFILLAAWDPRNGGIGCEGHHRRFDSHLTPALTVPRDALPGHVTDFAADWGLESQLELRFPQ